MIRDAPPAVKKEAETNGKKTSFALCKYIRITDLMAGTQLVRVWKGQKISDWLAHCI